MKAIVLAAGKGERLKGVLDGLPKPMVRVNGRPVLEQNIEWLAGYGIKDIYVNLHHLPHMIKECLGDGSRWGVDITYSHEPTLLGTAGAARKIADECWGSADDAFLVAYGDNLYDCDLGSIIESHNVKGGVASMAVYEKDDVSQSGIVVLDGDDRVVSFIEKPRPEEVVSHLVNAAIYILEPEVLNYIPAGKPLDFGRDVFPEMIQAGEKVYGITMKGNLTAIDTPELLKESTKGQ